MITRSRLALPLLLASLSLATLAAPADADHPFACHARMMQADPAMLHKHFDHEAAVLEIRPSQEALWQTYADASTAMLLAMPHHPPRPADAPAQPAPPTLTGAQRLQRMADHLHTMADKAATLAQAADHLEAALNPEQKIVFDRMIAMHGHEHCRPHRPMHMPAAH